MSRSQAPKLAKTETKNKMATAQEHCRSQGSGRSLSAATVQEDDRRGAYTSSQVDTDETQEGLLAKDGKDHINSRLDRCADLTSRRMHEVIAMVIKASVTASVLSRASISFGLQDALAVARGQSLSLGDDVSVA
uniref:Uncharacterized protein n=1 Tax=Sphaerodactylus townsendi TaxID=933632 RepID=A0ACB8FAG6_9SAUR